MTRQFTDIISRTHPRVHVGNEQRQIRERIIEQTFARFLVGGCLLSRKLSSVTVLITRMKITREKRGTRETASSHCVISSLEGSNRSEKA